MEKLIQFADERQAGILRELIATGSQSEAARKLGISRSSVKRAIDAVQRKAARQGHSPAHDMTHIVPDGYTVKGVSTYYDKEGKPAGQWVKSTVDRERMAEIMREMGEAWASDLPLSSPVQAPEYSDADLMTVYPIGDAHIGMLSWPEETGDDWNLDLAEKVHAKAIRQAVASAPASEVGVIVNLGDFLHLDNMEGVTTRSGHHLDTDGRYGKCAKVAVRVMRQAIADALQKHARVEVINAIGNHDDTGALWMSIALAHVYENDPRVTVHTSPSVFQYREFGKVLIGVHHGHTAKPGQLPGVMAADQAQAWGRTEHRYWLCGHVHHESRKEFPGVTVETFGTLAAKDAYAANGGYRAKRQTCAITYHRDHGEWSRTTINIGAIR